MLKIELIRFEAQDVITASNAHNLVGDRHPYWGKWYRWCTTHDRWEEV